MIQPTQDRVAIKPGAIETKSGGGILLPTDNDKVPNTGEIIAVGPGRYADDGTLIPMGVKVGQNVFYCDQYEIAGLEIHHDGLIIVDEKDIRAIIGSDDGN